MILKNHLAYRFLTDDSLAIEMLDSMYPDELEKIASGKGDEVDGRVSSLYHMVSKEDQKSYYITDTVLDKLDMLKIKKKHTEGIGEHYDWTVFKSLSNRKVTFIFPNNALLRMVIHDNILHFCHVEFTKEEIVKGDGKGKMNWVMFYVDRNTGEQCDHFNHIDVKTIEQFVYSLLCFMYLADNEEVIVEPGRKYGTKKSGKIINTFSTIPITIVNSKWNITSIRTDGFGVRGHFAVRWTGEGRQTPRLVLIEPFEKSGYVRKSGKETTLQ